MNASTLSRSTKEKAAHSHYKLAPDSKKKKKEKKRKVCKMNLSLAVSVIFEGGRWEKRNLIHSCMREESNACLKCLKQKKKKKKIKISNGGDEGGCEGGAGRKKNVSKESALSASLSVSYLCRAEHIFTLFLK